jgi:beta-aspartyl-peptidase (threonine type)
MRFLARTLTLLLATLPLGCTSAERTPAPDATEPRWAVAIHGGAGTLDRDAPPALVAEYRAALQAALDDATARLAAGQAAIDVAQAIVTRLEDDPKFNAGIGAALTADATHELDASIMDGATLRCGAVAGVTTVKNPIALARLVMDRTRHVLLTGPGAEQFATEMAVPRVPNSHFTTPRRREMWQQWRDKQSAALPSSHPAPDPRTTYSTVGCVVLDLRGNLASATSTGGLTGKRWGRVGDSPIIGAGTYANHIAAVSCTGTGEEFIRHAVARSVVARIELLGESPHVAANHLIHRVLKPDDGGLIVVDRHGRIAMPYNSQGMYRAAADSTGTRLVAIWE